MSLIITREGLIGRIIGEYAGKIGSYSNKRLFREYVRMFPRLHADEVEIVDIPWRKTKRRNFCA
jgi:hypothetical protein